MSTLHTVNKSPFEKSSVHSCLNHAQSGSAVLLYEDGVYAALRGAATEDQVKAAVKNVNVYVLGPDLKARGIPEDRVLEGIQVVDYGGFVDLSTEHDKVQAWT
jgi:tRNA 2-thiouridine synthesizing protein B